MHLTSVDGQVDTTEDFRLLHRGVEPFDVEQSAAHVPWFKPGLMKRMVSADPHRPRLQR